MRCGGEWHRIMWDPILKLKIASSGRLEAHEWRWQRSHGGTVNEHTGVKAGSQATSVPDVLVLGSCSETIGK